MNSTKKIHDKFTRLKVSRQRKYQLRHRRRRLCELCPATRVTSAFCLKHAIQTRERGRRYQGSRKRRNSLTYRLQKKIENNC